MTVLLADARVLADEVADVVARHAGNADIADVFPQASYDALRASGLTALTLPVRLGGGGGDLAQAADVVARVSRADASVGLVLAMQYLHGTGLFLDEPLSAPVTALGRRIVAEGGFVGGLVSEARSNAPHRGVVLDGRADAVDGGWRLRARKTYVTGSRVLTAARVTLAVGGDDSRRRSFLVPFDLPGVSVEPTWDAFGLRGSVGHDVLLDVVVPADHDLGAPPEQAAGATARPRQVGWFPVLLAAVSLGVGAAALDLVRGGAGVPSLHRPGADGPQWRHVALAGEAALQLQVAHAVLDDATRRSAAGTLGAAQAGATKVAVHRAATAAVDAVGRLVGTASVWADHPWQRLYRDLRVGLHHTPPEDVVAEALARDLLGG